MNKERQALEALWDFAHGRPGMDWRDYFGPYDFQACARGRTWHSNWDHMAGRCACQGCEGRRCYNRERGRVTRQLQRFVRTYGYAHRFDLPDGSIERMTRGERLTWDGERWNYTTGQYFPTEFRAAACEVVRRIVAADGAGWWATA